MTTLSSRQRFLAATRGEPLNRPPVWLMRQAGRYLPEYRALKEKYSFVEMVRTPALAVEVTLQPLQRFPLDAAIIFSDILVIPEALGQPYRFKEQGGIAMEFALQSADQIRRLQSHGAAERLQYVGKALAHARQALGDSTALLGFCGSPWTIATYMVEGGSPGDQPAILQLWRRDAALFDHLLSLITTATIDYLNLQIDSGVDAVQIFDSWGSLCPDDAYDDASLRWIRSIIQNLKRPVPVILFAKGMSHHRQALAQSGATILSLDWTTDLSRERELLPSHLGLQGNLHPDVLTGSVENTRRETQRLLVAMKDKRGHIFNLGHGLTPQAGVDNVGVLVETVCHFS